MGLTSYSKHRVILWACRITQVAIVIIWYFLLFGMVSPSLNHVFIMAGQVGLILLLSKAKRDSTLFGGWSTYGHQLKIDCGLIPSLSSRMSIIGVDTDGKSWDMSLRVQCVATHYSSIYRHVHKPVAHKNYDDIHVCIPFKNIACITTPVVVTNKPPQITFSVYYYTSGQSNGVWQQFYFANQGWTQQNISDITQEMTRRLSFVEQYAVCHFWTLSTNETMDIFAANLKWCNENLQRLLEMGVDMHKVDRYMALWQRENIVWCRPTYLRGTLKRFESLLGGHMESMANQVETRAKRISQLLQTIGQSSISLYGMNDELKIIQQAMSQCRPGMSNELLRQLDSVLERIEALTHTSEVSHFINMSESETNSNITIQVI